MTDHQVTLLAAAISTALPTLAVLIGILFNTRQVDSLRREMEARFSALENSLTSEIRRVESVLNAKIDVLSVRVKALEDEIRSPLVKR